MAQTSTLTIKQNGAPLVGAEVISSDAMQAIATTDGDGKITASLPNDYASCILVAIRHSSMPEVTYINVCILESGEDYEIDVPDYTGQETGRLYGIHSNFARKL